MELESAKNIGGVGAILLVIAALAIFANTYGGLLFLAGIILVLIGLKGMADNYKEAGIINNALYSVVTAIVGGVVTVGVLVASVLVFLSNAPDWLKTPLQAGDWQAFSNAVQQHISINDFSFLWTLIGSVIIALVVLFVFIVITTFFFRRSLGLLSTKSNVGLFGTTGLVLLIGGLLTIVLIGFVLIWISWIMLAVAFFQVKALPQPQAPSPPPPTPTTQP
jgi:uncharacterized membrane protein